MSRLPLPHPLPLLLVAASVMAACNPAAEVRPVPEADRVAVLEGPDAIPKELVAALLVRFTPEEGVAPEVLVGSLPSDLPVEIDPPEEGRLLGSLVQTSHGTIVYAVPQPPAETVRSYEARLRQQGWTEPPGRGGIGFQSSDAPRSMVLCRGTDHSLNLLAVAHPAQGSYLRIGYATHRDFSPCDPPERRGDLFRGAPIPTLYPPAGARLDDTSMGGSRHYTEAVARLEIDRTPAELVAHYGRQLGERGWSLVEESAGIALATQTWHLTEGGQREWYGVLLALALAEDSRREVVFRITSPDGFGALRQDSQ